MFDKVCINIAYRYTKYSQTVTIHSVFFFFKEKYENNKKKYFFSKGILCSVSQYSKLTCVENFKLSDYSYYDARLYLERRT